MVGSGKIERDFVRASGDYWTTVAEASSVSFETFAAAAAAAAGNETTMNCCDSGTRHFADALRF